MTHAILTHGGAASPNAYSNGCVAAAQAARAVIEAGGDALAAALAATVLLEDDPRFNAGTGSNLRLDGRTIEMDASVMTSDGRFGGVANLQRVKNPVLVAARVRETPHLLIAGEGATAFARRLGFPDFDPATEAARRKYDRALAELRGAGDGAFADDARVWRDIALDRVWNFGGDVFGAPAPASASPKTKAATPSAPSSATPRAASPPPPPPAAPSTCSAAASATPPSWDAVCMQAPEVQSPPPASAKRSSAASSPEQSTTGSRTA